MQTPPQNSGSTAALRLFKKRELWFIIHFVICLLQLPGYATQAQSYTTSTAGFWDDPLTWTQNTVPSSTDADITINHAVTIRTSVTVDQLQVNAPLIITTDGQMTVANGTSTDITVSGAGSLQVFGMMELSNGATHSGLSATNTNIETSGVYKHSYTTTEGVIPLANWKYSSGTGATLLIAGYTTATVATAAGNWSQNFSNVTWNCTNQTGEFNLDEKLGLESSGINSIQGNFTISSTGTSIIRVSKDNLPQTQPYALTVGGDFKITDQARFSVSSLSVNNNTKVILRVNGDFNFTSTAAAGSLICETGVSELTVLGDMIINAPGGAFYLSSGSGGSSSSGADLNVTGDFYLYAGTIDASVAGSNRVGEIFFNDKYSTGNLYHEFYNTGTTIGTMNYYITEGHTLRTLGESGLVGNGRLRVGDTGAATLIVESTAVDGAIQSGNGSGPGNVRTSTRTYGSNSVVVYGGSSTQYIGKDYPSTNNLNCQINNPAGVVVAAGNGGAVTIGGKLQVINGSLTVTNNNLTINQDTELIGGNLILNTSSFDLTPVSSTRTVTFNGALNMTGGQVSVTSGALDASNAILQINGDLTGTNYFTFSGANCRVNIGGTAPLTFSRDFPVNASCTLEQLTINRSGSTLVFPQSLTAGNLDNLTNSGVSLTNGNLKMNASLLVTTVLELTNGILHFEDQTVELRRNINTSLTGLLSSDESSTLHITSNFAGVANNLYFSPAGNTLGTLTLNRTANVSPHVSLQNSCTISGTLNLTDGAFYNVTGLNMGSNAVITRTPNGSFTTTSSTPTGGPYDVVYNDGTSPVSVSLGTGKEIAGLIDDVTINVTGIVSDTTAVLAYGTLMLNTGIFDNSLALLSMNDGSTISRKADGSITGAVPTNLPASGTYNLVYDNGSVATSLATGLEAKGRIYDVTVNNSDTLTVSDTLDLRHVMTLTTNATVVNSNGYLRLISTSELTDNTASIAAIPEGANVTGEVTVQRYMKSAGRVNRYIGMPLKNIPVSQLQDDFTITGPFSGTNYPCTGCANNGASLRWYNEKVAGNISNGYQRYPASSNSEGLVPGRGYVAFMNVDKNITLDLHGSINYDSVSLPVSYTTTSGGAVADGWNLVANPFPSAIQWGSTGWRRTNIDPVISVPDLGSETAYPTYYKTYNYIDGSGASFGNGGLPGGIIAQGQAFWVHVTASGPAELTVFEEAKTSAAGGAFYRSKTVQQSEQLVARISDGKNIDDSYLKINPEASVHFDHSFDGYKLKNDFMNVYFIDNDKRELVMHTLADIRKSDIISVGVQITEPGFYSLTFLNQENFKYDDLKLLDLEKNVSWPIENGGYEFAIAESTTQNNRFFLLREGNVSNLNEVLMYPNPASSAVNVYCPGGARVTLMDNSGNAIRTKIITEIDRFDISDLNPGLYFLKLNSPKTGLLVKKLIKN
jgi:hypothetical protein